MILIIKNTHLILNTNNKIKITKYFPLKQSAPIVFVYPNIGFEFLTNLKHNYIVSIIEKEKQIILIQSPFNYFYNCEMIKNKSWDTLLQLSTQLYLKNISHYSLISLTCANFLLLNKIQKQTFQKKYFIKNSYKGPAVQCIKGNFTTMTYDVNNQYAFLMLQKFPTGNSLWIRLRDFSNFFGFVQIKQDKIRYIFSEELPFIKKPFTVKKALLFGNKNIFKQYFSTKLPNFLKSRSIKKYLVTTMYGRFALKTSLRTSYEISSAITSYSRIFSYFFSYKFLYSDTDSFFLSKPLNLAYQTEVPGFFKNIFNSYWQTVEFTPWGKRFYSFYLTNNDKIFLLTKIKGFTSQHIIDSIALVSYNKFIFTYSEHIGNFHQKTYNFKIYKYVTLRYNLVNVYKTV